MKKIIILNSNTLGSGSDELGEVLIGSFLRKIWAAENKPNAIIFYNSAVKLLSEGSKVLDAAHGLNDAGVDLLACGTCIGYFKMQDKLAVGRESNMEEIVNLMLDAHVVTV
ncbi:sulfurtransferase-like selenium metabolism protein YedF [candidate division KSB1 bacterium]|nr:sulfurtransferase-like selenium metabolism protein YedF [candidate division KSB1 bacterium]